MLKFKILTYIVFFSSILTNNLLAEKVYMKYGKISEEEIAMTVCPIDSNASAVVLGAMGQSEFKITETDITLLFQKHLRIKILDKEAFDKGNYKIYLYKGSGGKREKVTNIKGAVYNIKEGKLEKSKLGNDNIFNKELDENHDVINLSFPDVKVGSIIEFSYQIESPYIFNLQSWRFQDDIPTLHSEYNVKIIEWYNYKNWMEGYIPIKRTEVKRMQNFSFRTAAKINTGAVHGLENSRTPGKTVNFNAEVSIINYLATNVPAFKNEPFITTPSDYISSIQFELQSRKYPWSGYKSYTTSWDKINQTLLDDEDFGLALNADGHLKDIAAEINSKASTPEEKARLAYEHIIHKITWNNSFRIYTSSNLRRPYNEGSGTSADINLNLIALCKLLNLEAYPVIVSTRKHGMIRPGLVSLTQFNHVITAVVMNGKYLLMDATDNNCPYNLLPDYTLNDKGRLVRPGLGDWIDLYTHTPKTEMYMVNLSIDKNLNLKGNLIYQGKNYAAINARSAYKQKESKDKFIQNIENELQNAEISDFTIDNVDSIYKPIVIKSDLVLKDRISQAGDMIFLNPKVINRTVENIFKREKRTYPVDYNYPINEQFYINITIPDEYVIDELPQQTLTSLPDNKARYVFSVTKIGEKTIQLTNQYQINQTIFSGMEYPDLRKFNELIVAKEAEQIVLKKVL